MTEQEIMQLAKEAGCIKEEWLEVNAEFMQRFAALVAESEREACAKICDRYASGRDHAWNEYTRSRECKQAAAAIRARGEKGGDE